MNKIVIASLAAGGVALSAASFYTGKILTQRKMKNLRRDELDLFQERMMAAAKVLETAGESDQAQDVRADLKEALKCAKAYVEFGLGLDYATVEVFLTDVEKFTKKQAVAA